MEGWDWKAGLRCKPGDIVQVKVSTLPELVGAFAYVEGWRTDGRWNVYLDRPTEGVGVLSGCLVTTREFCFRDASLVPIANLDEATRRKFSRQQVDHRLRDAVDELGETAVL